MTKADPKAGLSSKLSTDAPGFALQGKPPTFVLTEIGIALFGDDWRTPLAEAMGIHESQIRRWLKNGALTPDHPLFKKGVKLLRDHRDTLKLDAAIAHCLAASVDQWRKK